MSCYGSINRIKNLPPEEPSEFSAEGTAAHWVREMCLEFGFDPWDFIGTKIAADGFMFEVDDDMCTQLQYGIDRVRELPGKMFVEMRVDTTPWVGLDESGKPQFGTLDCGLAGDEEIIVNDLKFGRGVPVQAVGNKQIRIYGLAFWKQIARHITKAKRFRFIIDQPRHNEGGGEWIVSLDELLAFGEEVRIAAKATFDPNAPYAPSMSACQWCRAAKISGACPEQEAYLLDIFDKKFSDLDDAEDEFGLKKRFTLPYVGLTPARRSFIVQHSPMLRKWLDILHAETVNDGLNGGETPGLKVVAGRAGKRNHKDEAVSEEWLRPRLPAEKIFTKKLISVAQLDKELGKGVFPKSLVEQGDSKPALVPVEDERPALRTIESKFDALDDL